MLMVNENFRMRMKVVRECEDEDGESLFNVRFDYGTKNTYYSNLFDSRPEYRAEITEIYKNTIGDEDYLDAAIDEEQITLFDCEEGIIGYADEIDAENAVIVEISDLYDEEVQQVAADIADYVIGTMHGSFVIQTPFCEVELTAEAWGVEIPSQVKEYLFYN